MTDWAVVSIIFTIVIVGIMLGGIQLTMFNHLSRRMDALADKHDTIQRDMTDIKERLARLEGILIGRNELDLDTLSQPDDD